MVLSNQARHDVDMLCLTKTILYRKFSNEVSDLSYDSTNRVTYTEYSIKAQVTVQNLGSNFVQEGRLLQGDLVGLFRYEYTQQSNGTAITPTLVPKQGDIIVFNNIQYTIKDCTPATGEDDGIIGWDFTAGQNSTNNGNNY